MPECLFELDEVFLKDHPALLRATDIAAELDCIHAIDFDNDPLLGPLLKALPRTTSGSTISAVRELLQQAAEQSLIDKAQIVRLRSDSSEHDTAVVLVPGAGAFEIPNDCVCDLPSEPKNARPGSLRITTVRLCTDGYRGFPVEVLPEELKPHLA